VTGDGDVTLAARILGTATMLPGPARATAEVACDVAPQHGASWPTWEERTGIRARHWAPPGTRMAPLGAAALRGALDAAGLPAEALKRVIFVTSMVGDRMFPSTGNQVIAALGINRRCDTFDVNASCLGFLRGLDIAARSVATGLGPVGVVNVELGSRVIRPGEPRLYMRLGDAAVATVVGEARAGEGILSSHHVNHTLDLDEVYADSPQRKGKPTTFEVRPPQAARRGAALNALGDAVQRVIARAQLSLDAVDWFLFQQPSGRRLDAISNFLRLDPGRVVRVVDELGAIGSASIPAALDRLLRTRALRPGARLLFAGTGGGGGAGAVLYQVAPPPDGAAAPSKEVA
jgi:3-oxoacyl-(acyl-carrier-protein) synthase III